MSLLCHVRRSTVLALASFTSTPAWAHHPMGGTTPGTLAEGLLSGLGHPILGLDHFAVLIGVGLVASRFPRGLLLPPLFVLAMIIGAGLHTTGVDLPQGSALVALSVIVVGLTGAAPSRVPLPMSGGLFVFAGLVHGHALAEAIIGAEPTPLAAYFVGLVAIQSGLSLATIFLVRRIRGRSSEAAPAPLQLASLAVASVGVGTLLLNSA